VSSKLPLSLMFPHRNNIENTSLVVLMCELPFLLLSVLTEFHYCFVHSLNLNNVLIPSKEV